VCRRGCGARAVRSSHGAALWPAARLHRPDDTGGGVCKCVQCARQEGCAHSAELQQQPWTCVALQSPAVAVYNPPSAGDTHLMGAGRLARSCLKQGGDGLPQLLGVCRQRICCARRRCCGGWRRRVAAAGCVTTCGHARSLARRGRAAAPEQPRSSCCLGGSGRHAQSSSRSGIARVPERERDALVSGRRVECVGGVVGLLPGHLAVTLSIHQRTGGHIANALS
jgi:hypothetical protein